MQADDSIYIMRDFPDFTAPGFDMEVYNRRFKENNVIIHAKSSDVSYPEHWGCLSVKCAFKGNEYYQSSGQFYAVNDGNYLIFNEGKSYSSYIYSHTQVQSFTINFSSFFEQTVAYGLLANIHKMLDEPHDNLTKKIEFTEKLYPHNDTVSPVLNKLYYLSLAERPDNTVITECYYQLLENMLLQQAGINNEIKKIQAAKPSTQAELYKRLHYAKDYIDSCYMNNISLPQLSGVACLNSAYLLRQFKKYFGVTPYQYIICKRVEAARVLLETTVMPVSEVCFATGYEDVTSFTRLFRQHFQLTPEKYRLEHQKKSFFTCKE